MGPRFLVTGGTGFIGRRLVDHSITEFGADAVICLVKPAASSVEAASLQMCRERGITLIEADLRNPRLSAKPPPRVSTLFHLAANVNTDASAEDTDVNDRGTEHLLEWLSPTARSLRVVYASTAAVHDRDRHPVNEITEDSPLVPRTEYGRSKLRGERIIRTRALADGFTWTILRLPTVYGTGQKRDGLFERLLAGAAAGAWLTRIDWPGRTSILHVDDAAEIMIDLATRSEAAGEIFCVASETITVGALSARIASRAGQPVKPIVIPHAMLRILRAVIWNRALMSLLPTPMRRTCWRLSLLLSDGFWFDTTKFRRAYGRPLRLLDEGLAEMLGDEPSRRFVRVRGNELVGC